MTLLQTGKLLLISAMLLGGTIAKAEWQLLSEQSHINFVSIKKSAIGEVHTFKQVQGQIDSKGKASIQIALDSVETLIPVRNERMRSMLFETMKFPTAEITATVDAISLAKLEPGVVNNQEVDITLSLHGKKAMLKAQVQVASQLDNKISVTSIKPIVLNLGDFDLIAGVGRLQEVANLPVISIAVPGTVHLVFEKK
jgi:polyisoprenoid-binding protein YceI